MDPSNYSPALIAALRRESIVSKTALCLGTFGLLVACFDVGMSYWAEATKKAPDGSSQAFNSPIHWINFGCFVVGLAADVYVGLVQHLRYQKSLHTPLIIIKSLLLFITLITLFVTAAAIDQSDSPRAPEWANLGTSLGCIFLNPWGILLISLQKRYKNETAQARLDAHHAATTVPGRVQSWAENRELLSLSTGGQPRQRVVSGGGL